MKFPTSDYNYCAHESLEEINCPPLEFWPIYSWAWKGEVTNEGIALQLSTMAQRGIRRIYVIPVTSQFDGIQTQKETLYLSEEFMDRVNFLVKEADKCGIHLWLYDEDGWPSGAASGQVVLKNPELAALSVDSSKNKHLIPPLAQPYPDLLNKKSTNMFIKYTHEKYKEYFKDKLSTTFPVIFTDEPHVRSDDDTLPWTDGFEERFKEKFGYDIMEHFPSLFDESLMDEEDRRVRADYRDLLGEMFSQNYFLPIKEWCEANGILSTGHVGGDDVAFGNAKWGYHHILRCLRAMHIPGVDMIWRQVFPGPEMPGIEPYAPLCANRFFPRYASSAAHQTGARLALTESYAIYGAGLTYDQMRWVYNFQVVRGINVLNPMNMNYTHEGKCGPIAGLPNFVHNLPGATDLMEFNIWASRVSYLMSAGKPVVESALYMPFRDIWPADMRAKEAAELFESIGAELERQGCDIDVIDDDAILAANISGGALCIGDAKYRILYFQKGASVPVEVQEKLDLFCKNGGKLVTCIGDYFSDPIIKSNDSYLRAARRRVKEGTVYYITNEAFEAKNGKVFFPLETADTAWKIDLCTGEKTAVSVKPYIFNLALGEEVVLLFTDEKLSLAHQATYPSKYSLPLTDFTFRRLRRVMITPKGIEDKEVYEEPVNVKLGDWCVNAGEFFSGDAEYRTVFCREKSMGDEVLLDLGDVRYSCEVFLNGKSLCPKAFSPFVYKLSDIRDENELCIRVSNTMANAYAGARYEEWIPGYEPDYMKKLEMDFEKESLKSGLCGPVVIKW